MREKIGTWHGTDLYQYTGKDFPLVNVLLVEWPVEDILKEDNLTWLDQDLDRFNSKYGERRDLYMSPDRAIALKQAMSSASIADCLECNNDRMVSGWLGGFIPCPGCRGANYS